MKVLIAVELYDDTAKLIELDDVVIIVSHQSGIHIESKEYDFSVTLNKNKEIVFYYNPRDENVFDEYDTHGLGALAERLRCDKESIRFVEVSYKQFDELIKYSLHGLEE